MHIRNFLYMLLPEQLEPNSLVQYISTDYKFAISFAILIVVLIYRPNGIFKRKGNLKNNLDIKIAFTIMGLLIMLVGFPIMGSCSIDSQLMLNLIGNVHGSKYAMGLFGIN